MKKIIQLLLLVFACSIIITSLTGCKKDKDKDSLEGTTWDYAFVNYFGGDRKDILEFTSKESFKLTETEAGKIVTESERFYGKYKQKGDKIYFDCSRPEWGVGAYKADPLVSACVKGDILSVIIKQSDGTLETHDFIKR